MLAIFLAVLQPLACHFVQSDWIEGRDLAAAAPVFSRIEPATRIGLAPFPGQQRRFRLVELKRLAKAHQITDDITSEVCFTWNVKTPDPKSMLAAMHDTLGERATSIEIVESSLSRVPPGQLHFPLSGFSPGSEKASLWRGYVQYAGDKRFPIWATVIVSVSEQHLVSLIDLKYGEELAADEVKVETYVGPLRREEFLHDLHAIEGFRCTRPVHAGTELIAAMLEAPREVNRGEMVDAVMQTGTARLEVKGIAEDDGRKGQVISVRNPRSGRIFRARVEQKGVVIVIPGGPYGLVVEAKTS